MNTGRAFVFLALVTCLGTPSCQTISIGRDSLDAGGDSSVSGDVAREVARDAAGEGSHSCNEPGYPCPGSQICQPLQLGGWGCFPPGTQP